MFLGVEAEVESDAHRQQTRERSQRQEQRAQEEYGVGKQAADKLPSPGAERRVTRGMKARTEYLSAVAKGCW